MSEHEPIDLIETTPGEWRFVRLLRLAAGRHFKADSEARRERFFDSLAGDAVKPRADYWWTGGVAILLLVIMGCAVVAFLGKPHLLPLIPAIVGVFIFLTIILPELCSGSTLAQALRSLWRP